MRLRIKSGEKTATREDSRIVEVVKVEEECKGSL